MLIPQAKPRTELHASPLVGSHPNAAGCALRERPNINWRELPTRPTLKIRLEPGNTVKQRSEALAVAYRDMTHRTFMKSYC